VSRLKGPLGKKLGSWDPVDPHKVALEEGAAIIRRMPFLKNLGEYTMNAQGQRNEAHGRET
jgi:hypothetical protein